MSVNIEIEDKPLETIVVPKSKDFHDFVIALTKLKVGQSFEYPFLQNNHRTAFTIVGIMTGAKFATRTLEAAKKGKEGKYQIGRIE